MTLAHPDPAAIVAGEDIDPVTTSVVTSFGSWSDKPFAAIVLTAFIACGVAAQARDGADDLLDGARRRLPGSRFLRRVDRRQVPIGGIIATTVVGGLGLLLGLEATAVGSLIAFGTAAIYVSFLLVARRGADRAAARQLESRGPGPPRAARADDQRRRRRLARLRDGQHRLAAHVAGAAGRARSTRCGPPRSCLP